MRDRRHPGVWWPGAPRHRVDDQGQRATRFEQVVDGLGHPLLVGPVEGLTEGDQPVRTRRDRGQVLSQAPDPPNVRDAAFVSGAGALGQHAGVRVQADHRPEQVSQADGEHARAAAGVQQAAAPIQTQLPGQDGFQFW